MNSNLLQHVFKPHNTDEDMTFSKQEIKKSNIPHPHLTITDKELANNNDALTLVTDSVVKLFEDDLKLLGEDDDYGVTG